MLRDSVMTELGGESRAVQWVERLLEGAVRPDVLIEAARYIEPRHYSDVVEERNIEHRCGWPLCGNLLKDVPAAKYHISLERRVVVDLTQRKKFCRTNCYRQSQCFAAQLCSDPVWSRNDRFCVQVRLLDNGSPEDQLLEYSKQYGVGESVKEGTYTVDEGILKLTKPTQTASFAVQRMRPHVGSIEGISEKLSLSSVKEVKQENVREEVGDEVGEKEGDKEGVVKIEPCRFSSVDKIVYAITQWLTPETIQFLECCKDQELSKQGITMCEDTQTSSSDQLQRRIFMQQLESSLSSVAPLLGLSEDILPCIIRLAHTFRLSRTTITFRPAEWRVILCTLITSLQLADVRSSSLLPVWLISIGGTESDFQLMLSTLGSRTRNQ